ncbi:8403_t:CDS:1 [Funneliformis geosporum]|uniref:15711_t:CDS:1 n=1 Tax=Funneliformis geosporum TaxID=1117311 RepID=A0A9W4WSA5_9GLOM|nr:8403_t:CDS:1 [Funneliformis geosporum]CAI2168395.1 15711_t:CDS:1 [Funneliformis geosporum]
MTSKSYEQKSRMRPYVRKFNLLENNRQTKKKPPKFCPDCKETCNCVKLFSGKIHRIEEVVDNIYNGFPKKKAEKYSIFNAKFSINDVPFELEYDLTNFTLEELQKLANWTIQDFNNNNIDHNNHLPTSSLDKKNNEK